MHVHVWYIGELLYMECDHTPYSSLHQSVEILLKILVYCIALSKQGRAGLFSLCVPLYMRSVNAGVL